METSLDKKKKDAEKSTPRIIPPIARSFQSAPLEKIQRRRARGVDFLEQPVKMIGARRSPGRSAQKKSTFARTLFFIAKMTNKLELTWVGKDEPIRVEPRILIENAAFSNVSGDPHTENMLIHGDNLLALKALEQKFAGKVKCIYIDPPFNTGSAFEHYDDGLEHSIWLGLMRARLIVLHKLLSNDGLLFVQIDNRELHYLKVLLDEVFGRGNFRNGIIVKKGTKSLQKQFQTIERLNAGYDTILVYSKTSSLRVPNLFGKRDSTEIKGAWNNHWRGTDRPTMRFDLLGICPSTGQWRWAKERSFQAVSNYELLQKKYSSFNLLDMGQEEFDCLYKNYLSDNNILDKKDFELIRLSRKGKPEHYIPPTDEILLSENWLDLSVSGRSTDFEHEKNEFILQRILGWCTNPGDLVLDSFLGSGTTAAVAHKMNRRYIGVELGEQCFTHCVPRINKIINGEDKSGVTETVGWRGGGGYRFYELAPTLVNRDSLGVAVINQEYDAEMLAAAVALHEGFVYRPDRDVFWKQSQGSEKSYLFVTTRHLTASYLDSIAETMSDDEYLLIACRSFDCGLDKPRGNITVKKIPQMLLNRCEFGKSDYNLNVVNPPVYDEDEDEFDE